MTRTSVDAQNPVLARGRATCSRSGPTSMKGGTYLRPTSGCCSGSASGG